MRLKQSPEDFVVEELLAAPPGRRGPYFIHLLRKRKLDTLEAVAAVAREAGVPASRIGIAGLKDRQGITIQYLSIPGRRVEIRQRDLEVRLVGRAEEPIAPSSSRGNRFRVVLRALGPADLAVLEANLAEVRRWALPNYFDDQRFGCLRHGQGFPVRQILAGRPGDALRDLVAAPSPFDKPGVREVKAALLRSWGEWEACRAIGRKLGAEGVFRHLAAHPGDLFGAFRRIPQTIRLIHLFAFQSWLWNRAVSLCLRRELPPDGLVRLWTRMGPLAAHRRLPVGEAAAWLGATLPLPAAGATLADGAEGGRPAQGLAGAMRRVLDEEGLRLAELSLPRATGMAFKAEPRRLLLEPVAMAVGAPVPDERNAGLRAVALSFDLPRGAYATLVVKRLLAGAPPPAKDAPGPGVSGRGRR